MMARVVCFMMTRLSPFLRIWELLDDSHNMYGSELEVGQISRTHKQHHH